MKFDWFYQEFVKSLSEVVDNGRVIGDTPDERMDSCVNEVQFAMRNKIDDPDMNMIAILVKRHYNPN